MLLMLFLVFPLAYYIPGNDTGGSMENIWDSLTMVSNSKPLQWILLAFFLSVSSPSLPPSLPHHRVRLSESVKMSTISPYFYQKTN